MNLLLDPDAHPVIGHRGACGLAPENTMQSFALALEQGADALDFEGAVQGLMTFTEDFRGATTAFKEKRNPTYEGK